MGVVVRPARFRTAAERRSARFPAGRPRRRVIDGSLVGLVVAGIGLASILALAGTAFAVRALLVLLFAVIAGRPRPAPR